MEGRERNERERWKREKWERDMGERDERKSVSERETLTPTTGFSLVSPNRTVTVRNSGVTKYFNEGMMNRKKKLLPPSTTILRGLFSKNKAKYKTGALSQFGPSRLYYGYTYCIGYSRRNKKIL